MKNLFSWAFFFGAILMFVLSIVLPELIAILLVPTGILFAVLVVVIDCFRRQFSLNEQLLKWFLYSLLFIKFGQLYDLLWVVNISGGAAMILALVVIIRRAKHYEDLLDDARKIDNF